MGEKGEVSGGGGTLKKKETAYDQHRDSNTRFAQRIPKTMSRDMEQGQAEAGRGQCTMDDLVDIDIHQKQQHQQEQNPAESTNST